MEGSGPPLQLFDRPRKSKEGQHRGLGRLRSAIETWAKQQKDTPSRSEAIRRLIEIALTTKSKRQREVAGAARVLHNEAILRLQQCP